MHGFKDEGHALMAWHPPGLAMVELMVQVLSMPALVHGRALIGMANSAQWLDAAKKAQPEWVARMQDTYRMCELVYGELTYNHPNRPILFRQYCDIMAHHAVKPHAVVVPEGLGV